MMTSFMKTNQNWLSSKNNHQPYEIMSLFNSSYTPPHFGNQFSTEMRERHVMSGKRNTQLIASGLYSESVRFH